MQPWEVWRFGGDLACAELSIFKTEEAQEIDFSVWGWIARSCVLGEQKKSDVGGCVLLDSPTLGAPAVSLRSRDVPVLCLVDALLEVG